MHASMKFAVVCGVLIASATARGAEFPAIKPTYVAANYSATASPYSAARPTRVSMTNRLGQVSTLEYRSAPQYSDSVQYGALRPINDLPVLSSPARDEDLVPITNLQQVGYQYQANYGAQPQVRYAYQTPIVRTGGCAQPVVTQQPAIVSYPPATQYAAPNYAVPYAGAPQVVYRPVGPVAVPVRPSVQVSAGVYGQPVIYRPGQPVRNAWRWLTP
jgi:hypothetical protein